MFQISHLTMYPPILFYGMHYNYLSTHAYYLRQYQHVQNHYGELEGASTITGATSPRTIVVVIGESANRRHWSLYGYTRDTTPNLRQLAGQLFVFTDVISSTVGTLTSIRGMLTTEGDSTPIFHLFSGAGYTTHWISTQGDQGEFELELTALVASCDRRKYLSGAYDENLVPLLSNAIAEPGRNMVFLNMMGSHVRYRDRYPSNQAVFRGVGANAELQGEYDNTIHYTDYVLSRMIAVLAARAEPSCLLFVSDHGEDVFDSQPDKYLFRDDSIATDPMYEVPFFVWLSPEYVRENPAFVSEWIAKSRGKRFQNLALYHSLISLARLTHPLYRVEEDLLAPNFVERVRRVGVAGRLYDKQP